MAISESTAMARARAAKASFPKGPITIEQAKAMVLSMADSQVGYASGSSSWSLYGKQENWPKGSWSWNAGAAQNYWCYRGISWVFTMCFGRDATIAGIGNQGFPFPGWAATWLGMAWMRARGMSVSIKNARPADLSFQSWGRTNNPTDHIEIVTGRWSGSYLPHTGFNTSSGSGSVTTGATVAKVWRPSWPIKFIGRPNWAAIVATYNATVVAEEIIDFTRVAVSLKELGYSANEAGVRGYQKDKGLWGHNLTVDGVPGPATERALGESMSKIDTLLEGQQRIFKSLDNAGTSRNNIMRDVTKLRSERLNAHIKTTAILEQISNQVNVVGRIAREAREGVKVVPAKVAGFRVPFIKGTSLHRHFGDDFRLGALWGYGAAAYVDRDTHTEEIVDALDTDALESQMHANQGETENDEKAAEALTAGIQQTLRADSEAESDVAGDIEESVRALD